MNKKYINGFFFLVAIGVIASSLNLFARSNGTGIAGYTNAPSESDCTSCHSGTLQTNPSAMIQNTNFLGNGYFIDSTYSMTLAFKKTSTSKFGFSLTVLDEATNSPVGTLTSVTGSTQSSTTSIGGKTRSYVSHTSSSSASTSTDSIYWSFNWKAPSSNVGKIKFYAVVNATNNNNQSSGDVIYSKSFSYGLSNLYSIVDATSKDTNVCSSDTVHLKGSATNSATQYEWVIPTGTPSTSTAQNPSIIFNTSGTKSVSFRAKNQYGWGAYDTLKIVVNALPNASISGTNSRNLCEGDSIALTANIQSNTAYTWMPGGQTGNSIWVKDSGNYTVTAKNTFGCEKTSAIVRVDVIKKPKPILLENDISDTLCNLYPAKFKVTSITPFDSFDIYVNGLWQQKNTKNLDSFEVSPPAGDSFFVKILAYNGACLSVFSNEIKKYILPTPAIPIASCGSIVDSSITINWTTVNGVSGYEITKDSGQNWIALNASTTTFTHMGLTKGNTIAYRLRSVSAAACPKSNSAIVVCNTTPCVKPYSNISWTGIVCSNTDSKITINGLNSNKYRVTINNIAQTARNELTVNLQKDSTLVLAILDSNQLECGEYTESLSYTVQASNNPSIEVGSKDSLCIGTSLSIKALPNKSTIKYYFLESENGINYSALDSQIGNGNYLKIIDKSRQFFSVILKDGVCTEQVTSPLIYGMPTPIFTASQSASWYYHTLLANPKTNTYTWTDSKGNFADKIGDSVVYYFINQKGQSQEIYIKATDAFGCQKLDTLKFTVGDFLTISALKTGIDIYPNPTNDVLNFTNKTNATYLLQLTDIKGNKVLEFILPIGKYNVDVAKIAKGVYLLLDQNRQLIEKIEIK